MPHQSLGLRLRTPFFLNTKVYMHEHNNVDALLLTLIAIRDLDQALRILTKI